MKINANLPFRLIHDASELGSLIRIFRKSQQLTLEKVSGVTNLSMRFLSELERGKETAELGKALAVLNKIASNPRCLTMFYFLLIITCLLKSTSRR